VTTSVVVAVCDNAPLCPLIVSVLVVARARLARTVSVEVQDPGESDEGENEPLTRPGRPPTFSKTVPVKPLSGVTLTVYVVEPLLPIVREEGVTLIEKSGLGTLAPAVTVSVALTVWLRAPDWPVIVIGL
jgi:hypothetical protein